MGVMVRGRGQTFWLGLALGPVLHRTRSVGEPSSLPRADTGALFAPPGVEASEAWVQSPNTGDVKCRHWVLGKFPPIGYKLCIIWICQKEIYTRIRFPYLSSFMSGKGLAMPGLVPRSQPGNEAKPCHALVRAGLPPCCELVPAASSAPGGCVANFPHGAAVCGRWSVPPPRAQEGRRAGGRVDSAA